MLDICYSYASRWRFQNTANKSSVIIFIERRIDSSVKHYMLGENQVSREDNYVHLGIKYDSILSTKTCIAEACNKLRGTFLSICNSGVHPDGLNPVSSKKLYNVILIPKSLFGCELWSSISETGMLKLERSHRLCIK